VEICPSNGCFPIHSPPLLENLRSLCTLIEWMITQKVPSKDLLPAVEMASGLQAKFLTGSVLSDGLLAEWKRISPTASGTSDADVVITREITNLMLNSDYEGGPLVAYQLMTEFFGFLGPLNPSEEESLPEGVNSSTKLLDINRVSIDSLLWTTLTYLMGRVDDTKLVLEEASRDGSVAMQLLVSSKVHMVTIAQSLMLILRTAVPGGMNIINRIVTILGNFFKCVQCACSVSYEHLVRQLAIRMESTCDLAQIIGSTLAPLLDLTVNSLTPTTYEILPLMQKTEMDAIREQEEEKASGGKKGSAASGALASQLARERQCVPTLIFSIEACEQAILRLNALIRKLMGSSGGGAGGENSTISLVTHIHRSTARDFRIEKDRLEIMLSRAKSPGAEELENMERSLPTEAVVESNAVDKESQGMVHNSSGPLDDADSGDKSKAITQSMTLTMSSGMA